jgi:hypothetical protein
MATLNDWNEPIVPAVRVGSDMVLEQLRQAESS